ncbi:helix-turn-helix domain-containing protein [Ulvibacter antarcticus]|nr:helix-turn-helix transcriptional regulator [Ulvibacter antarcticus]
MVLKEEYIRLIFGLKLKQIRTKRNLSLFGLSKLSGLSKSYLNEIENGKKYPKRDKILILAEKLEVTYDEMVSTKLDKNLAPIGEILQSGILKEIPLEVFGIAESDLINIISNAPSKVNAFISTIIEIAQNYNLGIESFYLAALRSLQEAENNYFPEIEEAVLQFSEAYQLDLSENIKSMELEEILVEEYGYTIVPDAIDQSPGLENLRSIYVPKSKKLLLSSRMDEAQKAFIFAKEIGYNYLEISTRPYTFSWIEFKSFDEVLSNFQASYFAGALCIPRKRLQNELKKFLQLKKWDDKEMINMMQSFNASPESFYQRLTNILPNDFNFKNLFFLRFTHEEGAPKYYLKKELHITHHQEPHANEINEHYCRRWVSLKTLMEISTTKKSHVFNTQISEYENSKNQYLVISSATADPFKKGHYRSISIGILLTSSLQKKYPFLTNHNIPTAKVGVTCESCSITDCDVRAAAPKRVLKAASFKETVLKVEELTKKFE